MQKLQADIDWHREQVRITRLALAEADRPDNSTRAIETEALKSALLKFERTLAHLEELLARRS